MTELQEAFKKSWYQDYYHGNYKDCAFIGFKAGAEWQAKQSPWIKTTERLPTPTTDLVDDEKGVRQEKEKVFIKRDLMETPVLRIGEVLEPTRGLENCEFYIGRKYVCDGVFYDYRYATKHYISHIVCKIVEVSDEFKQKFNHVPFRFDINKIDDIAISILQAQPRLRGTTLLGWGSDDKSKNPNTMEGTYIFPDGNEYTLVLQCGTVEIYPGEKSRDYWKVPLSKFKIDKQQWAYEEKIVKID